jgi:general secretion pathway protein D
VSSPSGDQPIIGTRTIDSVIRLQDGETNFLAGLIRTDESNNDQGVPGLSDIPLLGRLFSKKRSEGQRTDVILTLTPHIIRNAEITQEDLEPIWVGTEANITFRGGSPRVESDVEGPFDTNEGTPEEIQDAIRRRLQRLPRGLRPGETGEEGGEGVEEGVPPDQVPPQPPPGVNLVPTAPPSDIFRQPATPEPTEPPPPDEEPPAGLVSQRSASGTAALAGRTLPASYQPSTAPTAVATTAAVTAPAAAPAVRLWLAPGKLTVAPGDRFEVRVQADAGQPVSHLPLALSFDPAVLAVEKVEDGDFLGGAGEAQVMSDSGRPGSLVIGASRLGKVAGVKGTGTVARITFRALAAGSSEIGFDGKALDAALKPLAVRSRAAVVEVGGEPEPRPRPSGREASPTGKR